ncbi:hypothetical protein NKH34_25090 [Mesorhizobium sp. M1148]|uniref:hypothetical protein n=1 Tax=unclassified Mesorhizobium TaxID=325217 RepID=UPI00333CE97D
MAEENATPYRMSEGARKTQERYRHAGTSVSAALQPLKDGADKMADIILAHLSPAEIKTINTLLKKGVDLGRIKARLAAN